MLCARRPLLVIVCLVMAGACRADTGSATQQLSAQLGAIGKLSVPASLLLTASGTTFMAFSGNLSLSYRVRTTLGGGGTITLRATSDFSPAGGPLISAGALTYACIGATLGAACSGTSAVSSTGQTLVVAIPGQACTGGGGACSVADPNSISINFILLNDPGYQTGTYSAQLTFTISAT